MLTASLILNAVLLALAVRYWRELRDEKAAAANLRWIEQRRRLEEAGLLKKEEWPEEING